MRLINLMFVVTGIIIGLVAGACTITHAAGVRPQITAGNVNATCSFAVAAIILNADSSYTISLPTTWNGSAPRFRQNNISADGNTFDMDGVAITNPPAVLQQVGNALAAAAPKIAAAYGAPAMQALVCGPVSPPAGP